MLLQLEPTRAEMTMDDVLLRLERLRAQLHAALDKANGDQLDPAVQEASSAFDEALNIYMRLALQKDQEE